MCVYTIMFLKTNLNKHSFMIYISGPKNICKIYIFRGGREWYQPPHHPVLILVQRVQDYHWSFGFGEAKFIEIFFIISR